MSPPTTPAAPQRRSFLAALSAFVATPAAVVTAAPAIAAVPVEPEPAEAPELLELGEALRSRLATYREAVARLAAAREHYERVKPAVPGELIVSSADRWSSDPLSAHEHDIDGSEVLPLRRLYRLKNLQVHLIVQDHIAPRSKEGKRLRRLVRLAKGYETAKAAALREAGYWEADEAVGSAAAGLVILADKLLLAEPATLAGARILAEAISAMGEARTPNHGAALGVHLAAALLRIGGTA